MLMIYYNAYTYHVSTWCWCPFLQARKSQHMGTEFKGLHVDKVLHTYITRTHLHLVSWLEMIGTLPLFSLYAFAARSRKTLPLAFTSLSTQLTFPELGQQALG